MRSSWRARWRAAQFRAPTSCRRIASSSVHLSVRRALVETRAQYVTTIRGLVRAAGERLPRATAPTFDRRVRAAALSAETHALIAPLLPVLTQLTQQIAVTEVKLATLAAHEPIIAVLTTAPGVGPI